MNKLIDFVFVESSIGPALMDSFEIAFLCVAPRGDSFVLLKLPVKGFNHRIFDEPLPFVRLVEIIKMSTNSKTCF